MSERPQSTGPVRFRYRRRPGATGVVLDEVERWTALTLGVAEVVTSYSTSTLATAESDVEAEAADATILADQLTAGDPDLNAADLVRVIPGALALLALRIQGSAFDAITGVENVVTEVFARFGAIRVTSPLAGRAHALLAELDAQFKAEQAERAQVASTFLAAAGPRTLDELLARIDLEAVLDRVDMEAVLDRVDMEAVLDRVDLDAVVARVDLDAVIDRLDVNDLMSGVINEIQVAGLLRDSTGALANTTGALANTTVEALRSQVGGVANRITGKK